jgi:predicted ATP-grasp superfamily ATP-dependent carboligase
MKKKVLVFSGAPYPGVQICRWLHDSLLFHPVAAASYPNHSHFVAEECVEDLPFVTDVNFIDALNDLITKRNIEFVIPTDDTIAMILTRESKRINAVIVCSPYETALLCRYKSKTYEALSGLSFVPKVYTSAAEATDEDFPLFAKPDDGQGAQGAYKVETRDALARSVSNERKMVVCEYLPGDEFTVDCFTNKHGNLLFVNPRRRARIQYGISARAESVEDEAEFATVAQKINEIIKFRGYWFIQLRRDKDGKLKLMELCTRFSGTFAHSQGLGVNLPLLSLCDFAGMDVSVIKNKYKLITDKSFIDRYDLGIDYSRVYIDYDDTITSCGGKRVNAIVMAIFINAGIKTGRLSF